MSGAVGNIFVYGNVQYDGRAFAYSFEGPMQPESETYNMLLVLTDWKDAWKAVFSVNDCYDNLTDILPNTPELLVPWIKSALESNTVKLQSDGHAKRRLETLFLQAVYVPEGVDLRFPPTGFLERQDARLFPTCCSAMHISLTQRYQDTRQICEHQAAQIASLTHALQEEKEKSDILLKENRALSASLNLAGATPEKNRGGAKRQASARLSLPFDEQTQTLGTQSMFGTQIGTQEPSLSASLMLEDSASAPVGGGLATIRPAREVATTRVAWGGARKRGRATAIR